MKTRIVILLVSVVAMLALAAPTWASDPGQDAYGGVLGVQSSGPTDVAQTSASSNGSTLPFTGYEAVLVLLGGVALLGTGVVVRRSTSQR